MIRKGTIYDHKTIFDFCTSDYMASQAILPRDKDLISEWVMEALQQGDVFVAEINGEFVGSSAIDECYLRYSRQPFASDRWMGVKPAYKGSIMAGKLILALECEATKRGLTFIPTVMGSLANISAFENRYERIGVIYRKAS